MDWASFAAGALIFGCFGICCGVFATAWFLSVLEHDFPQGELELEDGDRLDA